MTSENMKFRALVLRSLLMIIGILVKVPGLESNGLRSELSVEAAHYDRLAESLHALGK